MAAPAQQKGGDAAKAKPRPMTKAELRERVLATRREIEHGSTRRQWEASDFVEQLANVFRR